MRLKVTTTITREYTVDESWPVYRKGVPPFDEVAEDARAGARRSFGLNELKEDCTHTVEVVEVTE